MGGRIPVGPQEYFYPCQCVIPSRVHSEQLGEMESHHLNQDHQPVDLWANPKEDFPGVPNSINKSSLNRAWASPERQIGGMRREPRGRTFRSWDAPHPYPQADHQQNRGLCPPTYKEVNSANNTMSVDPELQKVRQATRHLDFSHGKPWAENPV